MYDKLTKVDIEKMQQELDYRIGVKRPEILEEVKLTRSYGDLSENAEYHAAKRERGKNESRIRYLRNMIKTAQIITVESRADAVTLFDTVHYKPEPDGEIETVRIMTTLRQDAEEMGNQAAQMLARQAEAGHPFTPEHISVAGHLIPGETVRQI